MPSGGKIPHTFTRQVTTEGGLWVGNQESLEAAAGGAGRTFKIRHKDTSVLPPYAFYGSPEWNAPADTAQGWEGIKWNPYLGGPANYSGIFNAAHFLAEHFGTGTLAQLRACLGSLSNTGGGQVAHGRCFSAAVSSGSSFFTDFFAYYVLSMGGANRCALAITSGLTGGTNHCGILVGQAAIPTGNFLLYNVHDYPFVSTGGMTLGSAAAPHASALAEFVSTAKGVLLPRMTTGQRDAIASPAVGLVIFNTTTVKLECFDGSLWQAAW